MKALLWKRYGPPESLVWGDAPTPVPGEGEVLLRVHATGLNAADLHLLQADPFVVRFFSGLTKPRFLTVGADVAGVVEAVGPGVQAWVPGDEVLGDLSACRWGGLAESVCAPEGALVRKPEALSFEEAAALPMAGCTALQALRKGGLQAGQRVLVHGATGGVGTFAVQQARALGARVTAVCRGTNAELVRSLGAERIIDYTQEDFVQSGETYDLILAANGNRSLRDYRSVLAPRGTSIATGGAMRQMVDVLVQGPFLSRRGQRFLTMTAQPSVTDLNELCRDVEAGRIGPVIDRRFPLAQGAEALAYLAQGHATGKVVVSGTV